MCLTNRNKSLKLNAANLQFAYQLAETPANSLFWSCLGFGGGPATAGGSRVVVSIRGGSVAIGRAISGVAGVVVLAGSLFACKSLADNDEAAAKENADEVKRIQDGITRDLFSQCKETSYRPLQDKADWWFRKYKRNRKHWEKRYRQCVEFFEDQEDENQDGNCATID